MDNRINDDMSAALQQYRLSSELLNNIPALIYSKDSETGAYLSCNQAFAEYANKKSPEEVIGLTDHDLFDFEKAERFEKNDRIALSSDGPRMFFEDVPEDSKDQAQYQTTKMKYTDSSGKLCILGFSVDVTLTANTAAAEVKEQEHEHMLSLQERIEEGEKSRGELEKMITALSAEYRAVYHVDLDRDEGICYRSDPTDFEQTTAGIYFPYLERFTWYGNHNVVKEYRDGFLNFIDPVNIKALLKNKKTISYRYLAQRAGQEYYEMIRFADARDENSDSEEIRSVSLGLSVIDRQMRDALAKNTALSEALEAAQEANKAKTAFLSNMSHEIRTPMNAIIGLDSLAMRNESLPEETLDYLRRIGQSANHLLRLINDILDMSRIESGRMVLRKVDFSFRDMLNQINTMVMSQCYEKGLKYECKLVGDIRDYYIGDDLKLKQVLINILGNAVKFTESPGSITLTIECVSVYKNQSTLKFSVKDTGVGMDESFIPKVFDTFTQEDGGRKNKYGSTGLGMAITKNLVDILNGSISVDSEKGVGTEFTVVLTLHHSAHENNASAYINPADMRVLIVDDSAVDAEHARVELAEYGIQADTAISGMQALRMMQVRQIKHEPYNFILMDWRMPDADGIEVTRQVRQYYGRDTTVIFLTSYNWEEIHDEAIRAGVDSFLSKPLFAADIIDEFKRIARKNKMSLVKEKQRAPLEGKRILLAEDIMINAEIIEELLQSNGIVIDHAENGKAAVDMFSGKDEGYYDAILMDVRMPEMDGLEATSAIRALDRADAKTVPIIAMTANAFDEDVQRSLQVGMNAHLTKPVEPERLYRMLGELIWEAENPEES